MKKAIFLITLAGLLTLSGMLTYAQAPGWIWAKSAEGGNGIDEGRSIAMDVQGNAYTTGIFGSPTLTFDTMVLSKISSISFSDIFIAKYDASGKVIWAKNAGVKATDNIYVYNVGSSSISADANGNSYITGSFSGDALNFDSVTVTSKGANGGVFIVKYDASGNVMWAKSAQESGYGGGGGTSISTDVNGNSYLAGYFYNDTITFDNIVLKGTVTGPGDEGGLYVAKYDPSGKVLWAKSFGLTHWDHISSIGVDGNGNSYITGYFQGPSISFDAITLTSIAPYGGLFVVKFNPSGQVMWARTAEESGNGGAQSTTLYVDAIGNPYINGYFNSQTISFDSYMFLNRNFSVMGYDAFFVKYDADGNVLSVKNAGGPVSSFDKSISVDASGNYYLTGNGLVSMYNASGDSLWTIFKYGCTAKSICSAPDGSLYLTGKFWSSAVAFGSTILTCEDPGYSKGDFFIAKLNSYTTGINTFNKSEMQVSIYPNPARNILTVENTSGIGNKTISIFNIRGQLLINQLIKRNRSDIDVSGLAKGMYFLKVNTDKGVELKKFVKE